MAESHKMNEECAAPLNKDVEDHASLPKVRQPIVLDEWWYWYVYYDHVWHGAQSKS